MARSDRPKLPGQFRCPGCSRGLSSQQALEKHILGRKQKCCSPEVFEAIKSDLLFKNPRLRATYNLNPIDSAEADIPIELGFQDNVPGHQGFPDNALGTFDFIY